MKKIKEPNPQVIKFESMDVIATSGDTPKVKKISLPAANYVGSEWFSSSN